MRIEESYYGDFKVTDIMPFAATDILRAASLIYKSYKVRTVNWPITIDFIEKTGYWEIWFTKPVSDEDYVAHMSAKAQVDEGLGYIQES